MNAIARYFRDLSTRAGDAWTQFWFAPGDPYTTSVLRIAGGLVTCWWLAVLSFDLQKLFGPQGWLPIDKMIEWRGGRGFSLFDFASSSSTLWIMHLVALAAAVMFTVGLFTRVTSIVTAVMLISYMWRAPLLNGEMELVLVMLVVYLCLGPCGAELSVDRYLARRREKHGMLLAHGTTDMDRPRLSSATTVSTRLIQIHLTAIVVSMALSQCRGGPWWMGEAVWWMAAKPDSRLVDFTHFLAGKLDVVNVWTHAIVIFEFAFAALVWNRWTRPLMLGLSLLVWFSVMLLTGMIGFCLLMPIASLAFVPPQALRSCNKRSEVEEVSQPHSVPRAREATAAAGS